LVKQPKTAVFLRKSLNPSGRQGVKGSVYFAIIGKSTAEAILPLGESDWLN